jgi:hypothetical protein
MNRSLFALLLLLPALAPAHAQGPIPDFTPSVEAMKAVAFMQGHWVGEGWAQQGQGPRHEFTMDEVIEPKLQGTLLLVEGVGYSKAAEPALIHNALGVVSFDPATKKYRFTAYSIGRAPLDVEPEIGANTFRWAFEPQPGVRVRYTSTVDGDTWNDAGEYSIDGQTWDRFFGMTLKRK